MGAFANDAVLVTALRESTVLYAAVALGASMATPIIEYSWRVDPALVERANQFISEFNKLTGSSIKPASEKHAAYFFSAYEDNELLGRCVRIGADDSKRPVRHYHWAINQTRRGYTVDEFWSNSLWTTSQYREEKLNLSY